MKISRSAVPSAITVLNMGCGLLSAIYASEGEYISAGWLIVLAAAFDFLDGIVARILKSSSEFGVQLDSLADIISFGLAPSLLAYRIHLHSLGNLGLLVSALPVILGGIRLARFNVELVGLDKNHFLGLPIPMSALVIATFTLMFYEQGSGLPYAASTVLPWIVVAICLLMISRVKYDVLRAPSREQFRHEPWKYVLVAAMSVTAIILKEKAMFWLLSFLVVMGMVRHVIAAVNHHGAAEEKPEDADAEPVKTTGLD